jgi:GNAT superfamily N-acetyltransferase|tara:strand:- start:1616 stop:2065 length:450 start_codon:yes stop_codon:yes gene_type:complete
MEFSEETLSQCLDEARPLLVDHWENIALNKDTIPLNPLWNIYEKLEETGNLKIITARQDEKLVGYAAYVISPSLHYSSEIIADADVFWLDPNHRKGMAGMRLFKHAEKVLKSYGVTRILNKVKIHFDVGKVFERMGYDPIERVYSKSLV